MRLITFILSFLFLTPIFSNGNYIDGLFIHPVSTYFDMNIEANNYDYPMEEKFIEDIIEVVSGMIYGWQFSYTPSDIRREIKEIFALTPVALIKKGDTSMKFRDNWVKDYIMYQNIVYQLADFQKKRVKSWHSVVVPTSNGEGEASLYEENGKSLSLHEAIKDSIKKEFQSRGKDKPRSIEGQILLKENPRLFIKSGAYKTQVEVLLIYKDIREYKYH